MLFRSSCSSMSSHLELVLRTSRLAEVLKEVEDDIVEADEVLEHYCEVHLVEQEISISCVIATLIVFDHHLDDRLVLA